MSDAKYDTPYKAYTGMGNALLKLGKSAEAGVAFREAALDEGNPDPTKALLNLGVCFMALDRPADAVASYESALQFDMQPDIAQQALREPRAGLRGLRPDAEGRERLRAVHQVLIRRTISCTRRN